MENNFGYMENIKDNKEYKVFHPISGHVIFTSPTNRQLEVLELYNKLIGKTRSKIKKSRKNQPEHYYQG